MYPFLYYLHVGTVCISGAFFALRGLWMLMESELLEKKLVRVLPHVIDTFLLLAAIGLAVLSQQYPFVEHWLTAKFIALVAYIGLGVFALRRGKTKAIRTMFLVLAIVTFGYMVSVALTRDVLGPLALI